MGWLEWFGTAGGRSKDLVRAENAAQPTDGDTTEKNCHYDDKGYPSPFEDAENWSVPSLVARPCQ
ncbi:hypothetical protein Mkiyose1088_24170 [Mycobacterium kiyosense]|uniref:Uncharacterized protein n=1 Tax=Mycobacterium kiyosense TaxID=2871094 RepID=A0A9P3QC27_9MYCO|nr:hypothetical protein IWGMT90018_26150 [Mycobacterium kiyosense]BDE14552.1 hypothetical protein MKCMC460_34120 [Mycobacterium sp. 20KCMC460]GLB92607.1 hypothetical protein SRL2020130_54240 [Mycobacterium kiyosense]GLC10811.1 hypothetical protein SRL2020411_54570 [Mycobacterium kiyosense]GLC16754.1 hypothetical protein SRL2020448_53570 [Mycobacterium kiyosense]